MRHVSRAPQDRQLQTASHSIRLHPLSPASESANETILWSPFSQERGFVGSFGEMRGFRRG